MEAWPDTLPGITESLVRQTRGTIIRSKSATGYTFQREIDTPRTEAAAISFEMDAIEFGIFRTFHRDALNVGQNWFTMTLPLRNTFEEYVVRFVEGRYGWTALDNNHWRINATLVIQELPLMTESELDTLL